MSPAVAVAPASDPEREAARARERLRPIAAEHPFEPRFLEQPDGLQHYVDEGPRDAAETLLCLHGNPTWSFLWRKLVLAQRARRRIVAPDHVGLGLSARPRRALRLAEHVANVERLIARLGLERVTLVLHDWGGPIGLGFARRHRGRVARLVLANTAAFASRRIPLRIALCRPPLLGEALVLGLNGFARAATRMASARPLSEAARRGFLLPYRDAGSRGAILGFVRDIPLAPAHPSWGELRAIEDALPSLVGVPTALVWGERDWCFTPRFRIEWERRLPQAEVHRIERAGHLVLEDAPEKALAAIDGFLARHPVRGGR